MSRKRRGPERRATVSGPLATTTSADIKHTTPRRAGIVTFPLSHV